MKRSDDSWSSVSPVSAAELAELRLLLQSRLDLLQQCARDLAAIDRRLYSLQNIAMHSATRAMTLPLTQREQQVLRLVANGLSNPEIGAVLRLQPNTVKNYLTRIMGKLLVKNRRQAVERAQVLGMI